MYYHVLIEFNKIIINKDNNYILKVDISENNLEDDYIFPYINDTDFFVEGYSFKKSDINRFLIKKSNLSIKSEAEKLKEIKYARDRASRIADFRNHDFFRYAFMDENITQDITKEVLKKYSKSFNKYEIGKSLEQSNNFSNKIFDTVFIVHGQDDNFKNEVARFVEQIGLKSIILHEQENKGNTIIEKIECYSEKANYAIILYTPCDKGCKNDNNELKPRARQNVIFEHGYFVAKLGRENVSAILKDDIEIPSDISGIVYIKYTNWKMDLVKELKSVGFSINF